jgi:hypothetical protein
MPEKNGPPKRAVSQLGVAIASLIVRLLRIFVTLCGRLALLAGFLTTALLLTGLLTRRLVLLTGSALVRHGVFPFMGTGE